MSQQLKQQSSLGIRGIFSLFKAGDYLVKHPELRKYVGLSILLNLLVFSVVIVAFFLVLMAIIQGIANTLQLELGGVVAGIFVVTSFVTALFITALLYSTISSAVNAPLYSQLAEKVLDLEGIKLHNQLQGFARVRDDLVKSLSFEFKKFSVSLLILLVSFVLNLIPAVGSVLFVIINAFQIITLAGLDILEPALARENLRFRDKLKFIYRNPGFWPFILSAGLLNTIPVLNLILAPLNLVGGLLLYAEAKQLNSGGKFAR